MNHDSNTKRVYRALSADANPDAVAVNVSRENTTRLKPVAAQRGREVDEASPTCSMPE